MDGLSQTFSESEPNSGPQNLDDQCHESLEDLALEALEVAHVPI